MNKLSLTKPSLFFGIGILFLSLFSISCETHDEINPSVEEFNTLDGKPTHLSGKYIVTLHESNINFRKTVNYEDAQAGMRKVAVDLVTKFGITPIQVDHVYGSLLTGFSATLSPQQVSALRADPSVQLVEEDGIAYAFADITQSPATWGIDRIDQAARPLSNSYTYSQTGEGVKVYILDTGIKYDHVEFTGRTQQGYSGYSDNGSDLNGHGTHVAGTVGGTVYGVAKKATLVSVKVLGNTGSGSWSTIIAGMDWVVANKGTSPAVVNMSLGGSGSSSTINDAVARLYNANVAVIVAAGNSNLDASGFTPANAPNAYAVGSSTNTDARSSFSNFGTTVKVFAPGSSITSAWYTGTTATSTISGTSMASPHVAGAAALLLQTNPSATAQQIYDLISANATKGVITSASSPNNHLLFTRASGGEVTPPPTVEPSPITLSATWAKVSGRLRVNLSYSGFASGTSVDIFRNGTRIATTTNITTYQDRTNLKGSGSLTYKVCVAGSNTCSSTITVAYN
ncbi:S8 family peptidase [Cognataquiflexum rubidum]|uniref:S8 family peptidase n=1 Tax=Cognataquiflexum rubidum TaxID=2922273 RepID=UPI001F13BA26|nr:S8 family peptidase [Cognataquiflexum rubidum]MCH6232450.1 S8 family peptidase [Cognataquiflexum rubidum]